MMTEPGAFDSEPGTGRLRRTINLRSPHILRNGTPRQLTVCTCRLRAKRPGASGGGQPFSLARV